MAKETYYFSHDYNAQQDPKMIELWGACGLKGVGFYWILIEHLHSTPDGKISKKQFDVLLKMYGKYYGAEVEYKEIQQVLNSTKLIVEDDDGFYYSNRVLQHKKDREELSKLRSMAGKKSAESRQKLTSVQQKLTSVQQKLTSVQQYKGKERKGKESIAQPPEFETFWKAYPNKKGKANALKAWVKLKPSLEKCLETLEGLRQTRQWTSDGGKYIPHPATWLNSGGWEDAVEVDVPKDDKFYIDELNRLRMHKFCAKYGDKMFAKYSDFYNSIQ